jgi:(2Fe-2S) ferredoxin
MIEASGTLLWIGAAHGYVVKRPGRQGSVLSMHVAMNDATHRIYLCAGPHCTAYGRTALRQTLIHALWLHSLNQTVELRDSGCQNRCELAPNLTIWPGPYHYVHLDAARIVRIVTEHLRNGQPFADESTI